MNNKLKYFIAVLVGFIGIGVLYYFIFNLLLKNYDTAFIGPVILIGLLFPYIKTVTGSNNN